MADNREYFTHEDNGSSIQISEEVIGNIVQSAVGEIEGVASLSQSLPGQLSGKKSARGIRVELQGDELAIDVYLLVRYGYTIPEIAAKVQTGVMSAVSAMTGFSVKTVNVHVAGVDFSD